MIRSRWIAIFAAIFVYLSLPSVWADSDPNAMMASRFKARFTTVKRTTSPSEVYSSRGRLEPETERLRINCVINAPEPNMVLGISGGGTIEQLEIDNGKRIEIAGQATHRPTTRYNPVFSCKRWVIPPKPPRWKRYIRSALRLPPPKGSQGYWADQVQPRRVALELDPNLLGPDCERINRLKGHFYVLMAESIEYIEIPFEPNEQWVRLPPDIEIKVAEAKSTQSEFKYEITREYSGAFPVFSPVSHLPSRFVAGLELLGRKGTKKDGQRTRERMTNSQLPAAVVAHASGHAGDLGIIEKFRFIIAVNPTHHKIPLELEDIPVPKP